jgi:alcohol dehydrogenase (cytochrome c)
MKHGIVVGLMGTVLFSVCASAGAAEVDDARLKLAPANDWLLPGRDYAGQRYSPLDAINSSTLGRLVPKWIYQSGIPATFQATPIVADGVMYVSLPFSSVVALDARTGRQIWRYEHKRGKGRLCCGPANRGVSIGYGKVFVATVDGQLVALDARTGKPAWTIALADAAADPTEQQSTLGKSEKLAEAPVTGSTGVGANMAPLVHAGRVIVGITGVGYGLHLEADRPGAPLGAVIGIAGRYGRPGFIAAYDAETGNKVWQFDTARPGWEGNYTATTSYGMPLPRDIDAEKAAASKHTEAWRFGGGSVWNTPALDAGLGLIYFGIGNPSPQAADESRPGDNLDTVSLVALDVETGKLKWAYQQVPHDLWGYDVASPPALFDVTINGETVPAVGEASKLGWYFVHDRRDGRLLFKSDPFVPQENLFARPTEAGVRITPGAAGGSNWSPAAVDGKAGRAYVAAMHIPFIYQRKVIPATADKPEIVYYELKPTQEPQWGTLSAIDLKHGGKIAWQARTDQPLVGGTLATAGGLVFTGEGNGDFSAFDASTGKRLWSFNCGAGVNAPPISFALDGHQYIAVAAGGSQIWGYPQGDAVIVFGLSE